jgi:protein-arginine kinase activator protein McsA
MNPVECPDCGRTAAPGERRGERACHNCNQRFEIAQCEDCGDHYATEDMTVENAPGATLWFCPNCATTRGVAYE